ncbi:hypothetical protein BDN72DRAFT_762932 [Pluteus cervinus]|uniref:Uncharacterized protein n=1 Tax=Pluteus cervinus TaxID=181527 RepID=A0ACD3B3K5_9AGAR|nr:hypothetical protein BDN72DRAFT_762932 [Pluteus cervinus]
MNTISDKPDWHKKVFDDAIVKKWKEEATSAALPNTEISDKMVDWCIEELRYKAKLPIFASHGAISVYDGDVVKSDTAIPQEVTEALKQAVVPLEDVPELQRDWHPGSNGQVLDLVHPSLFPLVYGTTRILPDSLTTLDDFAKRCGEGVTSSVPPESELGIEEKSQSYFRRTPDKVFSQKFQWLPCEVDISEDRPKITSYINNLHPQRHPELYKVVEDVLSSVIPLWNVTLTSRKAELLEWNRIIFTGPEFDPIPEDEGPQQEEDEDDHDFEQRREDWIRDNRRIVQPDAETFSPPSVRSHLKDQYFLPSGELKPEKTVDLKRDYGHRGLQVIVKLANIHLTPEKPSYPGGTWHVEGQLNEHICASAIYYYSNDNISTSTLGFRQLSDATADDLEYEQNDHDWIGPIFGCEQDGSVLQDLGGVETREGRVITFPNILQHQVQPFKLTDASRPGHRKILALFLVDPNIRVISTANVPCQRRDWWEQSIRELETDGGKKTKIGLTGLPVELADMVVKQVDGFPISLEEAKELREELMEERKKFVITHQGILEGFTISLCEH